MLRQRGALGIVSPRNCTTLPRAAVTRLRTGSSRLCACLNRPNNWSELVFQLRKRFSASNLARLFDASDCNTVQACNWNWKELLAFADAFKGKSVSLVFKQRFRTLCQSFMADFLRKVGLMETLCSVKALVPFISWATREMLSLDCHWAMYWDSHMAAVSLFGFRLITIGEKR